MPQTPSKGYAVLPGVVVENSIRERVEYVVELVRTRHPGRRVTKADVVRESICLGLELLQRRTEAQSDATNVAAPIERRVARGGRSKTHHAKQKNP